MTEEGIIQKVMQSWINRFAEDGDDELYLRVLQKQLIKEIEKASRLYGCTCWIETAALIGDKE